MIVYHPCLASDVRKYLSEGLARSEGRHYLFDRWEDMRLLMAALTPATEPGAERGALVLDLDPDMLLSGPIAQRRLPAALAADDVKRLQTRSRYPEVEVSAARKVEVSNELG